MGKSARVKEALLQTESKLRDDMEKLLAAKMRPADYSLGFTNGVIFCVHHLHGKPGRPTFYDQAASVGQLPMPVKFKHQEEEEALDNAEMDAKIQNIIDAARELVGGEEAQMFKPLQDALFEYEALMQKLDTKSLTPGAKEKTPSQEELGL